MDPCLVCPVSGPGPVPSDHPDALSATPYVYLIPTGQRRHACATARETERRSGFRTWQVHDHAHAAALQHRRQHSFSDVPTTGPLPPDAHRAVLPTAQTPGLPRRRQPRVLLQPEHPEDFTNRRLVGRSVWNTGWKLVIPGQALLADPVEGLDRFIRSVGDIQLYVKSYSFSGN